MPHTYERTYPGLNLVSLRKRTLCSEPVSYIPKYIVKHYVNIDSCFDAEDDDSVVKFCIPNNPLQKHF